MWITVREREGHWKSPLKRQKPVKAKENDIYRQVIITNKQSPQAANDNTRDTGAAHNQTMTEGVHCQKWPILLLPSRNAREKNLSLVCLFAPQSERMVGKGQRGRDAHALSSPCPQLVGERSQLRLVVGLLSLIYQPPNP